MAITSLDGYVAAAKQRVAITKLTSRTTVALQTFSVFDLSGAPGAGTLAAGNTTTGIIPTASVAGYPTLNAFNGGATGYLGKVKFGSTVACRIALFDRIWVSGAHAFNANQAITAPSYSARLPGADYKNLELWVEAVTASTGNLAVNVTYTNDAGTTGRTTGAVGVGAATTVGRCWQLPLAPGDSGIQSVTNITGSVATAGTFNVMVLRPLWEGRVRIANDGDNHDFLKCGAVLYQDSALYILVTPDSSATGFPDVNATIVNG